MKLFSDQLFSKLMGGCLSLSYNERLDTLKKSKAKFINFLERAYLKSSSNPDKSYSRQAATMCIATLIAYSAGGDGTVSRAEFEFVKKLFDSSDDYDIRYYLQISNGYEAFCYQISSNKGKFWTDNFIKTAKYLITEEKQCIAALMLTFAAADGEIKEEEKKSIVNFLDLID